jgi:hypothetical protein
MALFGFALYVCDLIITLSVQIMTCSGENMEEK